MGADATIRGSSNREHHGGPEKISDAPVEAIPDPKTLKDKPELDVDRLITNAVLKAMLGPAWQASFTELQAKLRSYKQQVLGLVCPDPTPSHLALALSHLQVRELQDTVQYQQEAHACDIKNMREEMQDAAGWLRLWQSHWDR